MSSIQPATEHANCLLKWPRCMDATCIHRELLSVPLFWELPNVLKILLVNEPADGKDYSPPEVDRTWLWVYYKKIPIYPIFYLLKADYNPNIYIYIYALL